MPAQKNIKKTEKKTEEKTVANNDG